ncbi:MAG: asparagine synthase (glutamine-hydrolyzing) [Deltaproteobacteria bacterium]|nr:asparagine synthase (glutamine-hydrolyzing) [Deltaproteobacteria bacterium]
MCGVAGLLESPGTTVDEAALRAMADALVHRGPDAGGVWRGQGAHGHVGLAHRRLSILDHKGGAQPMRAADAKVTVVFNGQLYDHLALRRDLEKRGRRFVSDHSDTETLVNAVAEWGAAACVGLTGMFAFGAVDEERGQLVLARDPLGKKPLYLATPAFFDGAPRLAFASELAALERLPRARRAVDVRALARYFAFDFVPDPDCIYQGVFKVPPGTVITLPLHDPAAWRAPLARAECYRPLSFSRVKPAAQRADRVVELRRALSAAVDKRLVADVPVGVFLSGGIDSSLVAALAVQSKRSVDTFCIAFHDRSFDESGWARRVAAHLGTHHHEQLLDEHALLEVLPRLGAHLSEPFADHSVLPTFLLSRFARERVTVALGGDGGDELFLGYPTFQAEALRPRLFDALAGPLGPLADGARALAGLLPVSHGDFSLDFKVQRTLDGVAEARPLRRHQRFLTGATNARLRALLSPAAREALGPEDVLTPLDELEADAARAGARDRFDVLQLGYLRTYLAAGVLQKVDRASMAVSLEVRAPLLDAAVVDLALALPSSDKLSRPATTKAILKEVATGLLPDDVIHRKKKGFGMPVAAWLCGPLQPLVRELLSPAALAADGLLEPAVVTRLVDDHLARRANHRKVLWQLLLWRLWRQRSVQAP